MVGMEQPCSFWPDKGFSILSYPPHPPLTLTIWLVSGCPATHSQPWPVLLWDAFLLRLFFRPSHLWKLFPRFLKTLGLGYPPINLIALTTTM
jgi:hypothetical protein